MKSFAKKFGQILKEGFRSPLRVIGALLVVALMVIGWEGLASWRAVDHALRACKIISPIGSRLTVDSVYGGGTSLITSKESDNLYVAWGESNAAFSADRRHFEHFGNAVGYFVINIDPIEGVPTNPEDEISPYELYVKVIHPTCTKITHLNSFEKLNFLRH